MRRRFVLRGGLLVEIDLESPVVVRQGPYVRGDIAPYRSMRTGETITGRAQHREHLRRYDLIEIGNERQTFDPPAPASINGEIAREIRGDIRRELARDPGERRSLAESALRGAGYDGPQIERILK